MCPTQFSSFQFQPLDSLHSDKLNVRKCSLETFTTRNVLFSIYDANNGMELREYNKHTNFKLLSSATVSAEEITT